MLETLNYTFLWLNAVWHVVLAWVVWADNPRRGLNKVVAMLSGCITFWLICLYLTQQPLWLSALFWLKLTFVASGLILGCLLWLSHLYPITRPNVSFIWIVFFIIFEILFTVGFLGTNWLIADSKQTPGLANFQTRPLFVTFLVWGMVISGKIMSNFRSNYINSMGLARIQLKYYFLGVGLSVSLAILLGGIYPLISHDFSLFPYTSVTTLFLTGLLAYTVIKNHLFDINVLAVRLLSQIITLGFIVASFIGLRLSVNQWLAFNYWIETVTLLLFIFIYGPTVSGVYRILEPLFRLPIYTTDQVLKSVGQIALSATSVKVFCLETANIVQKNLSHSNAYFGIKSAQGHYRLIGAKTALVGDFDNLVINIQTVKKNKVLVFDELAENSTKTLLLSMGIAVMVPLMANGRLHGYLVLTKKHKEASYTAQDINLLQLLQPQLAVALERLKAVEKIRTFNQKLQSKIYEATAELRNANTQLKKSNQLTKDLVFMATHEISNPLVVIRSLVTLLQNSRLHGKTEVRELLSQLAQATDRMVALVKDISAIARSDSQLVPIHRQKIALKPLIDEVVGYHQQLIQQKKLRVENLIANQVIVVADRDRLKEVVENLLSNAIKYSQEGVITWSTVMGKYKVKLLVSDQGVGIRRKDLQSLFTKFFRSDDQRNQVTGSGLGLYLVKQYLVAMGGSISCHSVYGKGSTFTIILPKQV